MTNEETVKSIKEGNTSLMWELYQCNKGIIYKIACKYRGYMEIDDLMQQAYIGLARAVDYFDLEKDTCFSTFLYRCVDGELYKYTNQHISSVRIPSHMSIKLSKYRNYVTDYKRTYACEPSDDTIKRALEISDSTLALIKKTLKNLKIRSLSEPSTDDEDCTLVDTIADSSRVEDDVIDEVTRQQDSKILYKALNELNDSGILKLRFMFELQYKDIGAILDKNVNTVSDIVRRNLGYLGRRKDVRLIRDDYDTVFNLGLHHNGVGLFQRTNTSSTEYAALKLLEI